MHFLDEPAIRGQQIDHRLVMILDGDGCVGRAFHGRASETRRALEQKPGDLVVAVVNRGIQGMAARGDALLGQIGIGTARATISRSRYALWRLAFLSGEPEPM